MPASHHDLYLDYETGDHPITYRVSSAGKHLQPWQAYANYVPTAGLVLYGHCGEGFVVDKVSGTPQEIPSYFDPPQTAEDMAMFDPGAAAASGKKDLQLDLIRTAFSNRRLSVFIGCHNKDRQEAGRKKGIPKSETVADSSKHVD